MAGFLPLLSFLLVALAVQPSEGQAGYGAIFLEKSLQPGSTMEIDLSRVTTGASLLPRQVADSIPFSSSKLPEILSRLSIDPSSEKAASIKKTLAKCEADALAGETNICATSFESMVDFAKSSLKSSNLRALSTSSAKAATSNRIYTIAGFNKVKTSDKLVACHTQEYAYIVYRCHLTAASAYTVSLSGADGTKVQALAACHTDAAAASDAGYSNNINVKPGSGRICHFLPEDVLLWVRA